MITGCLIFLAIICVVALAIAGALIVADLGAIILFVVALEDATFLFSNVTSVIVPEGVTHLDDNTFNTSGVKFVYLPSTLTEINDNFLSYFHDGDKLYYGGTQDQWDSLVTAERSDIDFQADRVRGVC